MALHKKALEAYGNPDDDLGIDPNDLQSIKAFQEEQAVELGIAEKDHEEKGETEEKEPKTVPVVFHRTETPALRIILAPNHVVQVWHLRARILLICVRLE